MSKRPKLPCALTIAGSDSGGGAGVQMDLKVFASLGVHGTSAITCVTAQNPDSVNGIQACKPEMVRAQIEAVFEGFEPAAIKTGMLYSKGIIHTVAETLDGLSYRPTLIVDPVMIATSGAALIIPQAIKTLIAKVLPLASLITPNTDEATALTGIQIADIEDLHSAARELHSLFGCAALVKGGHLRDSKEATDVFYDGTSEILLQAPFVNGVPTHGTGCAYSAAIAAHVARGQNLKTAVRSAKEHITRSISQSAKVGRQSVLNSFWEA